MDGAERQHWWTALVDTTGGRRWWTSLVDGSGGHEYGQQQYLWWLHNGFWGLRLQEDRLPEGYQGRRDLQLDARKPFLQVLDYRLQMHFPCKQRYWSNLNVKPGAET